MPIHNEKSVTRKTLADQVYEVLKEEIILQHTPYMKMGMKIKEVEIAKRLGCSPTPVREAINMLRQDNLIVGNSFHTSEIVSFSQKDIQDLLSLRTDLEVSALRQAVPNFTDFDVAVLQDIQKKYEKAHNGTDFTLISRINSDFHGYIIAKAENKTLSRILDGLTDQTVLLRAPIVEERKKKGTIISEAIAEHEGIIDAISRKDCEDACSQMRFHMQRIEKEVCEHYKKFGMTYGLCE